MIWSNWKTLLFKGAICQQCWGFNYSHGSLKKSQDVQYYWTSVRDHFDHHCGRNPTHNTSLTVPPFCCRSLWISAKLALQRMFPTLQQGLLIGNRSHCAHTLRLCTHVGSWTSFNQTPTNIPQECYYNASLLGGRALCFVFSYFKRSSSFCSVLSVLLFHKIHVLLFLLNTNKHCQMNVWFSLILEINPDTEIVFTGERKEEHHRHTEKKVNNLQQGCHLLCVTVIT